MTSGKQTRFERDQTPRMHWIEIPKQVMTDVKKNRHVQIDTL